MSEHPDSVIREVLETLKSTDAADAARRHAVNGQYRIARAWMTLAIEIGDQEESDRFAALRGDLGDALAEKTASVPLLRPPMRDDQPRTPQAPATPVTGVKGFDDAMRAGCLCEWRTDGNGNLVRFAYVDVCPLHWPTDVTQQIDLMQP